MAEGFQLPPIPPINPEEYKWKQSDTDPALWQRRACGSEVIVGLQEANTKGEYDLFYAATIELRSGQYTLNDVKLASQAAWRLLRYEEPQIAAMPRFDGQLKCLLQHRVPKDEQEIKSWVERTVLVEASDRSPMQIRDAHEKERQLKNLGPSECATIYVAATVTDSSTALGSTELRFLFRVNHLFFDGIGFRGMIAAFFRGLAIQLCQGVTDPGADTDWSTTVDRLAPACIELLVPEQKITGPEFDASMGDLLGNIMKGVQNWQLPTKNRQEGVSKTIWRTFAEDESKSIVKAIKERLGRDYTITNLGQAALLLAVLKMNPTGPETPDSQVYNCPTPINGRRFLQEPYQSYQKSYFPNCQCSGFILFENIKSYMQDGFHDVENTKGLLKKAATVSRDAYAVLLKRSNNLAISIPVMELFATIAAHNATAIETTVPMFTSYGIQEKYIPRELTSQTGEVILSVKDVHFWLNQHGSYPSIRLSSWRNVSRMSVDYNSASFDDDDMKVLLDDVADFMLLFAK